MVDPKQELVLIGIFLLGVAGTLIFKNLAFFFLVLVLEAIGITL